MGGQGDLNWLKHRFIPFIVNSQVSTDFALSEVLVLKAIFVNWNTRTLFLKEVFQRAGTIWSGHREEENRQLKREQEHRLQRNKGMDEFCNV